MLFLFATNLINLVYFKMFWANSEMVEVGYRI